jgi:cell shape-determining protein MreD
MGTGGLMQNWKAGERFLFPLLFVMSGIFVLLKGSMDRLLGIEWLDIDLIPIVVMYLLGKDKELRAEGLAFSMGILTDILAPCQLGLFALTYSAVTVGLNRCRRFLDFNKTKTLALLVGIYLLVKWAFISAVLRLFPAGQLIPSIPFVAVFASALITGLLALPLFHVLGLAGDEKPSGTRIAIAGDHHGRTLGF